MSQIWEQLKGKIDVSSYEEEQKINDKLKQMKNEFESLNGRIFGYTYTLGQYFGEYNPRVYEEMRQEREKKYKEIETFKKIHNVKL